MKLVRLIAVLMCLTPCGVTSAGAQTTSAVNAGIQFDFSLPGAKSLAMGGAFVALADDATAAQANPAGLLLQFIKKPQISIEGRGWNFFTFTPDQGHAFGTPTGVGSDSVLFKGRWPRAGAELSGVAGKELDDTTASISLITFVTPIGARRQWVIAGYRHQLLNLVNRTESSGPFLTLPSGDVARINPVTGRIEAQIATYGVSVARPIRGVSIGGGVSLSTFSINSRAQSFLLIPHGRLLQPSERELYTQVGEQFGPADFSDQKVFYIDEQEGEDTAWSYNVGVAVRIVDWLDVGGAFRNGPVFQYDTRFAGGPAHRLVPGSTDERELDRHENILFHVPDSYSTGFKITPANPVTLTFVQDYIRYKQLIDGSGDGQPVETAGQSRSEDPKVRADGIKSVEALAIDDAHQLRGGIEWAMLRRGPMEDNVYRTAIFLRMGGWYDPDHRLRSEVTDPQDVRILSGSVLLPNGKDEGHFSFGGGVLLGGRVQIDTGVDLSPRLNTLAISSVVYF